ncbi:hypothetical protein [Streptomyces sp. SID13031]|uniref:hypothetical protein n=1 Tax=Streptomyces sp. SID13031 TaxID=2706046 RepID=UPI0013C66C8B|nr:hypothetical protein [Streptomyces sp. SID13031]NEA32919.1 hypothetical protein [Streptomyces sp. SID13031]
MLQQDSRHRARAAALLGIVALTIGTGSTVAQARPAEAPLDWTRTPVKRQPAMLNDIDAHPGATWAVGSDQLGADEHRPLAMRWKNGRWTATPQPVRTSATLESVAVAGVNNVWAVGEDRADPIKTKPLVMHWNGSAWRVVPGPAVPTGSFGEVEIAPDGTPWMAGWADLGGSEHAVVYRYAGGKWQPLAAGLEQSINANALAVISATDVWLGLNAGLAHFDGKSWKLVDDLPTDGSQIPTALTAAGPKNIWLVGVQHTGGPEGERPLAMHYDGRSWKQVTVPAGSAQLYDVALRNGRPVAVGERFEIDENQFTTYPLVLELRGQEFVTAPAPAIDATTLTGIDIAQGRLWTSGITLDLKASEFAGFAAFSK